MIIIFYQSINFWKPFPQFFFCLWLSELFQKKKKNCSTDVTTTHRKSMMKNDIESSSWIHIFPFKTFALSKYVNDGKDKLRILYRSSTMLYFDILQIDVNNLYKMTLHYRFKSKLFMTTKFAALLFENRYLVILSILDGIFANECKNDVVQRKIMKSIFFLLRSY